MSISALVLLLLLQGSEPAPTTAEEAVAPAAAADDAAPVDDKDEGDDATGDPPGPTPVQSVSEPDKSAVFAPGTVVPAAATRADHGAVSEKRDPTAALWWTSLGVISGAALLAPLGVLPSIVLIGFGGTIVNLAGDTISGRHGTWATSVAMVGGVFVATIVVLGLGAVGLGMAIAGSGGIIGLNQGPENPALRVAGYGVAAVGIVGGPALGAILPTWAYLATATDAPPLE